ncbi:MAG: flavin reductase [Lachnospiraceae bacterium]
MNKKSFQKVSYGLYLISTKDHERSSGCVINTFAQVTSEPAQVTIAINKDNYTTQVIQESGYFTCVVLSQSATMELIGAFGFHTSKDYDKFKGFETSIDLNGIPYVKEQASARFSCKVINQMEVGSHIVFLAEVQDAEVLDDAVPMTYAYYHTVKKGMTPPKASSYNPEPAKGYRCKICGYVLESTTIPEDFICPICGRGKEELETHC